MYHANRIRHRLKYVLSSIMTLLVLVGGISTLCPTAEAVQDLNVHYQNIQAPNGRKIVLPFTFAQSDRNRGVATFVFIQSVDDADAHLGFRIAIDRNPAIVNVALVTVPGNLEPIQLENRADLGDRGHLAVAVPLPITTRSTDANCTIVEGVVDEGYGVLDGIAQDPHQFALNIRYKSRPNDVTQQPQENFSIVEIPQRFHHSADRARPFTFANSFTEYSHGGIGGGGIQRLDNPIPFNDRTIFPVVQQAAPLDIGRDLPLSPADSPPANDGGGQSNQQPATDGLAPPPPHPEANAAGNLAQPIGPGLASGATPFNMAAAPVGLNGRPAVTLGMGRTQQYGIGLPQAPVFHPYHPAGDDPNPGPHARDGIGIVSTPFAARLHGGHFAALPQSVIAALAAENINPANVDINIVEQNMPWTPNTQILFRPHYWTDPAAPTFGNYNTANQVRAGLFETDGGLSIAGQAPGAMGAYGISVHPGPEQAGRGPVVVSSPDNMAVLGLGHLNSTSGWSVVRNGQRAAVTLHLALNDDDHETFQNCMLSFQDLNDLILGLADNRLGGPWVAKLTALIRGAGPAPVAQALGVPVPQAGPGAARPGVAPPSSANTQQLPAPARGWNQATIDNPQSTGGQTVVLQHRGTLMVANRANNGGIRIGRFNPANRTWQFQPIGSANCNARSLAGVVHNGAIHIFATGLQGEQSSICHLSSGDGQVWQEEHVDVGQSSGLGLSAAVYRGRINIACRDNEFLFQNGVGQIRHVFQGRRGWKTETIANDAADGTRTAIGEYGGQLHVLYTTRAQELGHTWYTHADNRWAHGAAARGVAPNTAINVSTYGGQFHINYEGAGNQIIHRWFAPTTGQWAQETIAADILHGSSIATATFGDQYHLVYGSAGNRLAHRWYDAPTARWYNETLDNGNVTAIGGLAMTEYNGNFHILTTTPTNGLRHNYYQP